MHTQRLEIQTSFMMGRMHPTQGTQVRVRIRPRPRPRRPEGGAPAMVSGAVWAHTAIPSMLLNVALAPRTGAVSRSPKSFGLDGAQHAGETATLRIVHQQDVKKTACLRARPPTLRSGMHPCFEKLVGCRILDRGRRRRGPQQTLGKGPAQFTHLHHRRGA